MATSTATASSISTTCSCWRRITAARTRPRCSPIQSAETCYNPPRVWPLHASLAVAARDRHVLAAGARARTGAVPAVQHRADAGRAGRPPEPRRAARAGGAALGPGAALGERPIDRQSDDQRAGGDGGAEAGVPRLLPP